MQKVSRTTSAGALEADIASVQLADEECIRVTDATD